MGLFVLVFGGCGKEYEVDFAGTADEKSSWLEKLSGKSWVKSLPGFCAGEDKDDCFRSSSIYET